MNFLGMGPLEIVAILLVAFIFLGPGRMAEAARFLGKMVGDLRRMSSELPTIVLDEEEAPIVRRRGGPGLAAPGAGEAGTDEEDDGPVAFRRKAAAPAPEPEAREEGGIDR